MMIELWVLVGLLLGILGTIGWQFWRRRVNQRPGPFSVIGTHEDGTTRVLYRGPDLNQAKYAYNYSTGFVAIAFYVDAKQRGRRLLGAQQ